MKVENIQNFFEERKLSRYQLLTFLLCGLVVFLDGFDTLAIGYVAPSLMSEWGVTKMALGPVFASSLVGLMIGALFFGPLADRFGRKPVLVTSVVMFGLFTLLTAMSRGIVELSVLRFLTGLGLGGAMPIAVALTSEYAPSRIRSTVVMIMFCGFSLGGGAGGMLAARIIEDYGWHSVFVVGGVQPVLLAIWLMFSLPESVRYLAVTKKSNHLIAKILRKMDPRVAYDSDTRFTVHEEKPAGFPVVALFRDNRAMLTVLLWFMFFMSLFQIFFVSNWMPTILGSNGIPRENALMITAMFPIGGTIGTLVLGRFVDTRRPYMVIALVYFAAAAFVGALGLIGGSSYTLLAVCAFAAGFCSIGAQVGTNALAAAAYPTMIRSTGVGWALGIGRIGAIISALLSGFLLSLQLSISEAFLIGAVPMFLAALTAMLLNMQGKNHRLGGGVTLSKADV